MERTTQEFYGSTLLEKQVGDSTHSSFTSTWSKPFYQTKEWWFLEFLSSFIGTLAVIALVVVLREYDQHPLSVWTAGVTVNSVISLLTALSKAALVLPTAACLSQLKWTWFSARERSLADFDSFDRASRGVWGSLCLLWRLRCWYVSNGSILEIDERSDHKH
jgi:hypothetical protein